MRNDSIKIKRNFKKQGVKQNQAKEFFQSEWVQEKKCNNYHRQKS